MFKRMITLLLCALLLSGACLAEANPAANAIPGEERPLKELFDASAEPAATEDTDSYVPDTLDRVVVGSDDRVTIAYPNFYPYSAIAYMVVHASCGCDWTGSGFMVSPSGMLTASHCIVCPDHHMSADRITLYFGYSSNRNYVYLYDGPTTYWYGTDFRDTDGYDSDWDYAFVLLNERVGDRTGWFGTSVLSDDELPNKFFTVAGYRDGVLKYDYGFSTVASSNLISFQADTQPGNSGGPIFYYNTPNDVRAAAIIVSESSTMMQNYGHRINGYIFNEMKAKGVLD